MPTIPQLQPVRRAIYVDRVEFIPAGPHEELRLIVHELADQERAEVGTGRAVVDLHVGRSDVRAGTRAPFRGLVHRQPTLADSRRRLIRRDRPHADDARIRKVGEHPHVER